MTSRSLTGRSRPLWKGPISAKLENKEVGQTIQYGTPARRGGLGEDAETEMTVRVDVRVYRRLVAGGIQESDLGRVDWIGLAEFEAEAEGLYTIDERLFTRAMSGCDEEDARPV